MERSGFILDEGYHFNYYTDSAGADFTTDTGGDICLGFQMGDRWVYQSGDMYRAPVITASYPDMVRYQFSPFEGIRAEAWFVVHSFTVALLDLQLEIEMGPPLDITVLPFIRAPASWFRTIKKTAAVFRIDTRERPVKRTPN